MDANRRIDRQLTQALAPGATPPLLSLAMRLPAPNAMKRMDAPLQHRPKKLLNQNSAAPALLFALNKNPLACLVLRFF